MNTMDGRGASTGNDDDGDGDGNGNDDGRGVCGRGVSTGNGDDDDEDALLLCRQLLHDKVLESAAERSMVLKTFIGLMQIRVRLHMHAYIGTEYMCILDRQILLIDR